ncbi:glycoside hydrolase family 5 protein [Streptomyces chrestomyceticus]|uniref:glycoside hydrolase family 5 protein n=1 Tax=Streptomyces chrestomyceticus TaxID=68185 RepID=UPI0036C99DCD
MRRPLRLYALAVTAALALAGASPTAWGAPAAPVTPADSAALVASAAPATVAAPAVSSAPAAPAAAVPSAVSPAPVASRAAPPQLRVEGNRFVDRTGTPRRLLGVNRSGAEFSCVQGRGIFDGPVDDASVAAIAGWGANTVRVPLNEECWLGTPNIDPRYAGAAYTSAVRDYVRRLTAHGLTPVLELHWSHGRYTGPSAGCADEHASCQKPMPDRRHSPAFWSSVAGTFKNAPEVVFDLFNEPYPDRATPDAERAWACWRDGGTCPGIGYEVAGMQTLVDAVRATGARNPVLVGGLAYANDLGRWAAYAPKDPAGNLAAAWHVYNFNACADESCWSRTVGPVADRVPLVTGEIGENTCAHAFTDRVMRWLDGRRASYLGWTWNTWDCAAGPALIRDYAGTPTAYGVGLRDHLRALNPA